LKVKKKKKKKTGGYFILACQTEKYRITNSPILKLSQIEDAVLKYGQLRM